ncbi:ligand-binding sensor domain-containing diguanylate cyclase [Xanthomonas campestris]|uniref:ligand-binding sensor domain-containing diguanylate cyclase n=1 Tax=Xanthomonas campestris TaxID=339 RepID=UPI0005C5EDE4|nr:ligand-binding sensor domain-containing diguanylate cyclase [Xanthomonas campestris]MEA9660473.1 diguanylate cyclase [Xanthomonas campestris pv. raphani]MEA9776867.1 diguanylate cyclase [Xanthomonas campestris pv. raphani]MEA9916907.1 diguanylate cyclase [Xanthomonas campestris pv. raphani]
MPTLPALLALLLPCRGSLRARPWLRALCMLVLALLGTAGAAHAQTFSFREYDQADGLQGMSINGILEDRNGAVWVATETALHRFERDRFVPVGAEQGLDARYTRALTLDRAGRLWVATANGVFVRIGERFEQVHYNGKRIRADAGNVIAAYRNGVAVVSDNTLLALTPAAVTGWQVQPLPLRAADGTVLPPRRALLADGNDLWVACEATVCRLDAHGTLVEVLSDEEGVPAKRWRVIFRDRAGRLWLRGGGLIVSRGPGEARFRSHPSTAQATFNTLSGATTMVEDPQGRLLTRADHGLVRWQDGHWTAIGADQGLHLDAMVGPLLQQSTGTLWIGTRGMGIQRWLGYGSIEHLTEAQGMAAAPTWAIQRLPDGTLAVGADGGGSLLPAQAQRAQPWLQHDGQPLPQALTIAVAPDGAGWVSFFSGAIARRDPITGQTRRVMDLPSPVYKLVFDRSGTLWMATPRGIYHGSSQAPYPLAPDVALAGTFIGDLDLDAQGRLWAATADGLYRRDGNRWVQVPVHGDLPSQDLFQLDFAADGDLWVSLREVGLWHGRVQPDGSVALQAVTDPLVSKVMPFILRHDRKGRLWVGSSQGLDLYQHGHWSRITRAEGLLWDDMSANAFFEDTDGSIWIGSSRGLSHLRQPERLFAAPPLRVEIAQVQRGERSLRADASVGWSETPLEIDLRTPGVEGGPERISFRYRVEGRQARWTTTSLSHITYPLLPPGNYTLEVQALDAYQRSASPIAQFAFALRPPWWRSALAIVAYVLAGIGGVIALLRWRMRKLLARKQELEHLIAERTAELEQDKRDLEAARAALTHKATHDELTGLLNRAGILEALRGMLDSAPLREQPLAVVLIDLDYFKQVNDQHGHLAGDAVLAGVGKRLNALVRGNDRIGRYGGEELLALLPGLGADATHRLDALHAGICGDYPTGEVVLPITCSIGVAWRHPGDSVEQLLARADAALYLAKRNGRNRIAYDAAPQLHASDAARNADNAG